jgi:hypothetical protein
MKNILISNFKKEKCQSIKLGKYKSTFDIQTSQLFFPISNLIRR